MSADHPTPSSSSKKKKKSKPKKSATDDPKQQVNYSWFDYCRNEENVQWLCGVEYFKNVSH